MRWNNFHNKYTTKKKMINIKPNLNLVWSLYQEYDVIPNIIPIWIMHALSDSLHNNWTTSYEYDAQLRFGLLGPKYRPESLWAWVLDRLAYYFSLPRNKTLTIYHYIEHTRLLLQLRRRHINPNSCCRRGQSIGLYLITIIFLFFVFEFPFCVWLSSNDEFLRCLTLSCNYRSNFRSFIS